MAKICPLDVDGLPLGRCRLCGVVFPDDGSGMCDRCYMYFGELERVPPSDSGSSTSVDGRPNPEGCENSPGGIEKEE